MVKCSLKLANSNTRTVPQNMPYMAKKQMNVQCGPERSRQSNMAVFTVESEFDQKFPYVK